MTGDLDTLLDGYHGAVPGASLLVVRDGEAVVRRSYGLADLELGVAATPATNYRLASITKQFTAAAILLLVEDGKLGLDESVRHWLPELAADATIRQLLCHRSGLVDYEDILPATLDSPLRDADVLRLLAAEERVYFAAGSDYRYSNTGYALLALIVERVSGLAFEDVLRERVFAPLGMANTLASVESGLSVPNRAFGYSEIDGRWLRTDQDATSSVLGDGGIYSSIDDLARWDAALYGGRLLSDSSRRLSFTAHTATDDPGVQYGFGWRISGDCVWHSGESIGFRNVILRFPARRLSVILLSNRNSPEPYATAMAMASF